MPAWQFGGACTLRLKSGSRPSAKRAMSRGGMARLRPAGLDFAAGPDNLAPKNTS
jgi:hypothetical protein